MMNNREGFCDKTGIYQLYFIFDVGSQMAVTQLSSDAERTKDLARLGFSFGLGMIVGPSLGGIVTSEYG